jgi:hypothetical protein
VVQKTYVSCRANIGSTIAAWLGMTDRSFEARSFSLMFMQKKFPFGIFNQFKEPLQRVYHHLVQITRNIFTNDTFFMVPILFAFGGKV